MLGLSKDAGAPSVKLPRLSRRPSLYILGRQPTRPLWISLRRFVVFILAFVTIWRLFPIAYSSSTPTSTSTWPASLTDLRSHRKIPSLGRKNTGWIRFDGRVDSPFLPRYHQTAPPTRHELRFSLECRDLWISQGVLCPELQAGWRREGPLSVDHTLDVVYTWQNGSDPIQSAARQMAAMDTTLGQSGTGEHHFRDHDELKYSLRSLFKAFSRFPEAIGRVFIYSSDFALDPASPDSDSDANERIGSVPKWLNVHHPSHAASRLEAVFPWQTYKTPAAASVEEARDWRERALPAFQSMAVESQFANIDFEEYMLYSCDDFFLFNELSPSDVYTPLFGPTFRFRIKHKTYKPINPEEYTGSRVHERLSLTNAAFVIGKRFGNRNHRYIEHVNKVYNKPLLQEMQSCFAEELRDAAAVKLRGRGPDLNIHSLFMHYVIERHREALLWSVVVAKADANADGLLDQTEYEALLKSLGYRRGSKIKVPQPRRTIDTGSLLKQAGLQQPLETGLDFTSMDGYALMLEQGHKLGVHSYPKLKKPGRSQFCTLRLERCFGSNSTSTAPSNSTSELFKHVAFDAPECGDCMIAALLGETSKGLEPFLPSRASARLASSASVTIDHLDTPVLPLTKTWQETDFSLVKVLPVDVSPRDFVTQLLLRYSYTMGSQSSRLLRLHNASEGRMELGRLKPDSVMLGVGKLVLPKNPSFVGINDDIEEDEAVLNTMLHGWFELQWPEPLDWEV